MLPFHDLHLQEQAHLQVQVQHAPVPRQTLHQAEQRVRQRIADFIRRPFKRQGPVILPLFQRVRDPRLQAHNAGLVFRQLLFRHPVLEDEYVKFLQVFEKRLLLLKDR